MKKIIAGADSMETLMEAKGMVSRMDKRTAAYSDLKAKIEVRMAEF